MDLQNLVDSYEPMSCIISVQVFPDGNYGNIRILCGNKAYIASIESPDNIAFSQMLKNEFIPNSPYEKYIPKDLNFEDAVYRCAVLKKPFHAFIHPERYPFWVDMYLMPIAADKDDTYYLVYSQDLTTEIDTESMSHIESSVATAVLETCIKLRGTDDFKHTMDEVIKDIQMQCEADKICLILIDKQMRKYSILSEAAGSPIADYPVEDYLRGTYDDFFEIIDTWEDTIAGSTCLIIQNERDMEVLDERNHEWCESLKKVDVNSIVLYPLIYNNETLGYIWAINFNTENTMRIRSILEVSTYFIASEIANHKLLDQLKIMGSFDMLTGVKNRNAMNQRVDKIVAGEEELPDQNAVLFVDLNGLKQVNDNKGHDNGDVFLKNTANILKETFPDDDIYRAGGDEFMVLATDISKEEVEDKIDKLKTYRSTSKDVSFSLGCCPFDGTSDIRQAMSIADKKMYDDKRLYYEQNPDIKRN